LGIEPHFELWKYFFAVSLQKKMENRVELSVLMGCASIHLRSGRAARYIPIALTKSNKGWHRLWFYLKNDTIAPLPVFSGRLIVEVPPSWGYGPVEEKAMRSHRRRCASEEWWRSRGWRHRSIPCKGGGAADGVRPPALWDDA
jgi:hypothetical protein